jgi:hypothetical protein
MQPIQRIALATSSNYPDLTLDDRLLPPALTGLGLHAEPAVWNDPGVEWQRFRAVVLRSAWDYHLRVNEFLDWLARIETLGIPIWNPPVIVRWNAHKTYLRDLEKKKISIIPTIWVERNDAASLGEILKDADWREAVVKPAVSATAHGMFRTSMNRAGADQPAVDSLLQNGTIMVQPFVEEVCSKGEWSLMFFDRKYSHAVLKRPKEGDYRVQNDFGGSVIAQISPERFIVDAERAIGTVDGPLLYARVDGIEVANQLCVVEMELIEPALFLANSDSAPARLAEVISHFIERIAY